MPFGNFKVFDKDYVKENLFIHDYFISKGLDKTKAGGVCAFITSKGTLDKQSVKARTIFAKKAELLGAIRLPNTAFKAQAGTEVVADVLFFKKRENYIDNPTDSWINSSVTEEGIKLNNYFIEHPEMILRKSLMKKGNLLAFFGLMKIMQQETRYMILILKWAQLSKART